MSSLNEVNLIGNVGADPEFKAFESGDRMASFSLATTEKWKDKQGNAVERTEWIRVSCTNQGLLKVIEGYVKKGTKLYVQGKLETRTWEKNGEKKYLTEVVLRPYGGKIILLSSGSGDSSGAAQSTRENQSENGDVYSLAIEDEIPF
jgi:single-strand DNA-binding protein